ncbi:MAG: hypothetical protein J1E97_03055 [Muribaculaceae bacterium]|nr:hypothetical protein [Muribaculaceae bacterium]
MFGKRLAGPSNFNEFSLRLRKATGRSVSVSTLKRIWGYVDYPHEPSTEVLSILAAFAGYRDWYDFRSADAVVDSSDFLSSDIVRASDLMPGAKVQLRWKPDRVCVAEYLGNSEFRVTEAENGKLNVGDVFSCAVMAKGEPMICQDVRRAGEVIAEGYVAGKTDGIISIMVMK